MDGVHVPRGGGGRGLLPGQCAGGVGRTLTPVPTATHLLLRGVPGSGRLPGRGSGRASGRAGGRVGADGLPRLPGSQLLGPGTDTSFGVIATGYSSGPIPACTHSSQVSVTALHTDEIH